MHSKKIKAVIISSFTVGMLAMVFSIFLQARNQTVQGFFSRNLHIAMADTAAASLKPPFEIPGQPIQISIPVIGVDAAIQSVGFSANGSGEMDVPTNLTDVAWFNQGPRPGMPGSAVIAGHLNGKGLSKGVFYDISRLQLEDIVEVSDEAGKTLRFRVVSIKTYSYNASTVDVFSGDTSKARLNLITCAGDWIYSKKIYNKRTVVFTELVTD